VGYGQRKEAAKMYILKVGLEYVRIPIDSAAD